MASGVSIRHHFFRDLPSAVLLLGCAVIGIVALSILFPYLPPMVRERPTRLPSKDLKPQLNEFGFDKRYAGKIITGSAYEDKCRQLILDNRNGDLWDKGYANCDSVLRPFVQQDHRKIMNEFRLREVGKAFRHELN